MSNKLKIYFAGSIRGGRDDAALYARLIQQLKAYGDIFTEHVGSLTVEKDEDKGGLTSKQIHDRDMAWMEQSDVEEKKSSYSHPRQQTRKQQGDRLLVAEVTQPSLGVGYEIGRAVALNKKTLCLFRPDSGKKLSCMIDGVDLPNFTVKYYKEEDVLAILKEFFG